MIQGTVHPVKVMLNRVKLCLKWLLTLGYQEYQVLYTHLELIKAQFSRVEDWQHSKQFPFTISTEGVVLESVGH